MRQFYRLGKLDMHGALGSDRFGAGQLGQAFHPGLCLFGFTGFGLETVDEFLQMFAFSLFLLEADLLQTQMLGTLTLACSLIAGYDMANRKRLNLLHSAGFALVLAVTVYVIIDLEYPRVGLIQMTDSDQVLADLRQSMN